MKKVLALSTIFFLFFFLEACISAETPVPPTVDPSAQPLLTTLAVIAKTVDGIAGSATAYSFTPTLIPTPTVTPNVVEVNKTISDAINAQLIANFEAKITVEAVKFGPIGAQEFTNLYIEIKCEGGNNATCPTTHVIIAVVDAIKEKKKKILENIPSKTELLTITIFDPKTLPKVVEVKWLDVLAYIDGELPGENFNELIRYVQ